MAADPPPAVAEPLVPGTPQGMLEVGAFLGTTIWWAEQLFSVTGAWVPTVPEASVRIHVAELSRVLGGHAVALRADLPRPAPVDPEAWIRPGTPVAGAVVTALSAPTSSLERLAGLHRSVLPRLTTAWALAARGRGDHEGRALTRHLRHAAADLAELATDGESLLQALLDADPAAERLGAVVQALEASWSAADGLLGGRVPTLP